MWSGYCEAADSLEAHADKFCAILRVMRETARGTAVQQALRGHLPWMVLLQIDSCKLPKPGYRPGDLTRKAFRNKRPARTYFQFQAGLRRRSTADELTQITPKEWCTVGRAVLMRLFTRDEFEVHVTA